MITRPIDTKAQFSSQSKGNWLALGSQSLGLALSLGMFVGCSSPGSNLSFPSPSTILQNPTRVPAPPNGSYQVPNGYNTPLGLSSPAGIQPLGSTNSVLGLSPSNSDLASNLNPLSSDGSNANWRPSNETSITNLVSPNNSLSKSISAGDFVSTAGVSGVSGLSSKGLSPSSPSMTSMPVGTGVSQVPPAVLQPMNVLDLSEAPMSESTSKASGSLSDSSNDEWHAKIQ